MGRLCPVSGLRFQVSGFKEKLIFWGQSFISDAFGKVLKRGTKNKDEIVLHKINIAQNKKVQEEWGFMRNRRIDTYQTLTNKKNDRK